MTTEVKSAADIVRDARRLERPALGIGAAVPRQDGRAKVTGAAVYAGDAQWPGLLHGVFATAAIANGRILRIDAQAAKAAAGVMQVLTHEDMPALTLAPVPPAAQSFTPMTSDRIYYEGQPIAIVLAETLEQAEHAAGLIEVEYQSDPPQLFGTGEEKVPEGGYVFTEVDTLKGDVEGGIAAADAVVTAGYSLPSRHHNPMEPSATVARWDGGKLVMHDATQWTYGIRYALAAVFGIAVTDISVTCPFTGGAFGCKGYVWPHQILAAAAARIAGRPVKIVLRRSDMYTSAGYQPAMRQMVTLAAKSDGTLTAVRHKTVSVSSAFDDYIEFGAAGTRAMYATPAMETISRMQHANVGTPTAMRAPHEGPGMFALESAMDELAEKLGLDPLELRLRNYAEQDPKDGRPFSSKELRQCYVEGARRFGWADRRAEPRSMRQGRQFLGWGVASAVMTTFRFPASARARLKADGGVILEAGTQEIGTGTATIFPQIVAGVIGLPPERVAMRLGDSSLPETGGTFGSSSTLAIGSAVKATAEKLRDRLIELAVAQNSSPLAGARPEDIVARDGRLVLASDDSRSDAYRDILGRANLDEVAAEGSWSPGVPFDAAGGASGFSMHSFGAIFAEVAVDPDLGLVRLKRCVAGYSAGRIINPITARSQITGGIIWGYGQAVLEESHVEPRMGRFLSKNLAGVMLPVNADIPDIDVFFADEHDPHASAIGARGIGEVASVGVSAAIANAVHHATGKRVRDLPIKIEQLI